MIGRRVGDGIEIDASVQYLAEAPHWQGEGETVDVVDDEPTGEETTENVPTPGAERPDVEGQSTLDDWGGGSA